MTEKQIKQKEEIDRNCRTCEYDDGLICLCESECKNGECWKKTKDKE